MEKLDQHILPSSTDTSIWTITKTILRNEYVDTPRKANNNMYFVKKGVVKICLFNDDKETILNFATEGDLLCNLISFITGRPSEVYLQAIKEDRIDWHAQNHFRPSDKQRS